ncbi:MAG: S8 family serine peptidase, partial [Caldilineaceae bacterium]|nr:S8 family serine peptidase [Caldilineaceae bacterium]
MHAHRKHLAGGKTRVTYQFYNNLDRDLAEFALTFTAAPIYGVVTAAGSAADAGGIFQATQTTASGVVTCHFSIRTGRVLARDQQVQFSCTYAEAASTSTVAYETTSPAPSAADVNFNQVHDLLDQAVKGDGAALLPVIVMFDRAVTPADRALFVQHGGSILEEFASIHAFLGQIPANKLLGYRAAAPVAFIDASLSAQPELDVATRNSRADRAWLGDTDGNTNPISETLHAVEGDKQTAIAIVDSGLDDAHPSLSGFQDVRTLAGGWGALNAATKIVGWYNWSGSASIFDTDGHGSHVAGIAAGDGGGGAGALDLRGVAHHARLVGVRVPTAGTTDFITRTVVAGLVWLRPFLDDYHVVAVNQSLGLATASPAWEMATRALIQAGVVAVKSAGNSFHTTAPGSSSITTPGGEPKVLTVGAVNDADRVAYFSSNALAG